MHYFYRFLACSERIIIFAHPLTCITHAADSLTTTNTTRIMIKDIAHIALNPLDMDKTVNYLESVFGWNDDRS